MENRAYRRAEWTAQGTRTEPVPRCCRHALLQESFHAWPTGFQPLTTPGNGGAHAEVRGANRVCRGCHGLPQGDREFSLEGRKKRSGIAGAAPVRECPTCSAVVAIQMRICPECGTVLFVERDVPTETNSELIEITASPTPRRRKPNGPSLSETVRRAARSGGRLSWGELGEARGCRPEAGG